MKSGSRFCVNSVSGTNCSFYSQSGVFAWRGEGWLFLRVARGIKWATYVVHRVPRPLRLRMSRGAKSQNQLTLVTCARVARRSLLFSSRAAKVKKGLTVKTRATWPSVCPTRGRHASVFWYTRRQTWTRHRSAALSVNAFPASL